MKTAIFGIAAALMLFAAAVGSVYSQEASSANLKLIPSQERIPSADWRTAPEYIIPQIGSPPSPPPERRQPSPPPVERREPLSPPPVERREPPAPPAEPPAVRSSAPFKAPLVSDLERGKWYVQIGAYARAVHVDEAVKRAGTDIPVVIHNAGTDKEPMFRVLLGPFSQSESKTVMQRFKGKGYDAFLRSGN